MKSQFTYHRKGLISFFGCISILLLSCIPLLFIQCESRHSARIDAIMQDVKTHHAPDSRTSVFDVQVKQSGERILLTGELMSRQAHKALIDSLKTLDLTIIDSISLLPEAMLGADTMGVVRLSVCNIRSEPRHSAELVTQELLGKPVRILKSEEKWHFIQTHDGYLGWVDNAGILPKTQITREWMQKPKLLFIEPFGKIHAGPSDTSAMVADLVLGCLLVPDSLQSSLNYEAITLPDGRHGFVRKDHLISTDDLQQRYPAEGSSVVRTAKEFLGIPYLWGGTSPKGFDCSGFTKRVMEMHGITLQRDASQQVRAGEDLGAILDFGNFCPGDLLYFGRITDEGEEKVTHVAIYIEDGRIIHAAGEVRIQSLRDGDQDYAPERVESFLRAKRVLSEQACK